MQKPMKKTVMSHSLAKALMEAGMEHFDVGGVVSQGTQDVLSPASGILNGLSNAFTNQNKYNAQLAPTQDTNYGGIIGQGNDQIVAGYARAAQDRQQQQMLQDILLQAAQGQGGPSPAQIQLAQATGNNVNNQAALMAGTRGGGANVGLLAKQAAQQGGAIQQQSANDAALLRANEQLAARQQLQQQQALIGGQNISNQGVGLNQLNIGATGQNTQNRNTIENYGMAQGINAKTAQENAKAVNDTQGGLLKGIGSAFSGGLFANGGEVPDHLHKVAKIAYPDHFKDGGFVEEYRNHNFSDEKPQGPDLMSLIGPMLAAGGGGMKQGGKVPGHAVTKGDSTKNDTTLGLLSPGEVVLPRSVTQAKDAPSKAAAFMQAIMDKKQKKDYGRVAQSKKSLKDRVAMLEQKLGGK